MRKKIKMTQKNSQRRETAPYIRFCSICRPVLRELNPNLSLSEMGMIFGILWASIPEQNRIQVVNFMTTEILRIALQRSLTQINSPNNQ